MRSLVNLTRRAAARSAVALALAATAGLVSNATSAATTWDLPLAWPDGNFHVENARTFASGVARVTDGRVTINIHPGGSLGFKGPEMLTAIRDGLVPIGDALMIQQVGEAPLLGLEAQPYLVNGFGELAKLHDHFRPAAEKVAAQFNQKILYLVPWPRQYVYTKTPITRVEDLKGIKIRTYNKTTTALFNAVGMTAVQLPWGEVVPSLAAGTIDAVTTSASSGVDGKFWEFLKYMYPTNHVLSSNMMSVNLDAWNAISEADRNAIETLADELQPTFWEVSANEDGAKSKILNDHGVEMGVVDDAMMAAMRDATSSMVDEFVASTPGAKEVLDAHFKALGR